MDNKKQYGLLLPKKNQLSAPIVGNVFGNEDDSEEEEGTDWVKKALIAENEKNKIKKQTKLNMQKALKEDPTIYQYDEVYDEMERTKEEERSVKKIEKKAKYIDNLLKCADLRKKEQELRKDRLIQKEIEAEDAMFPDKERYVTSSYKAKLEEMKKFEEEQAYKDGLEAITDVTKQSDMSGFYRHLYRQTVERNDADLGISHKIEKPKGESDGNAQLHPDIDKDDPIPSDSESEESHKIETENTEETLKRSSITKIKGKRQYRKREQEESASESDPESEKEKEEDIEKETSPKKQKLLENVEDKKLDENDKLPTDAINKENQDNSEEPKDSETNASVAEVAKPKPVVKKKVDIWKKVTVGPVFEAALQRYLIRKQERLAGL